MFDLEADLPDDTVLEKVRLPTRIRNAAKFAGLKTLGELRETTDETFISLPNLGTGSVKWLRTRLANDNLKRMPMTPRYAGHLDKGWTSSLA